MINVKHCISVVALAILGGLALHYDQIELAGVAVGAIASWGLVNGARTINKRLSLRSSKSALKPSLRRN